MSKLKEIMSVFNGTISIQLNEHVNRRKSVDEMITDYEAIVSDSYVPISNDVKEEMIKRNTIISVYAYADINEWSQIIDVHHFDIDIALEEMAAKLNKL